MEMTAIQSAPAITTKPISGACIPTIPSGTPFMVTILIPPYGAADTLPYSSCDGLPVTQIWKDEYMLVT